MFLIYNVPVNLNELNLGFFCLYFKHDSDMTAANCHKPRLLRPLCTSSLDFLFINIWIVHFCEKIIYSVCVRLIQLNSGKKVESWKLSWKLGGVISPILTQSFFCIVIFLKSTGFNFNFKCNLRVNLLFSDSKTMAVKCDQALRDNYRTFSFVTTH